uniref:Uncharacterized protein n=1 Tax=Anopheles culicifacies TaxID=139723 RepID=A0A182MIV2_9DIPT
MSHFLPVAKGSIHTPTTRTAHGNATSNDATTCSTLRTTNVVDAVASTAIISGGDRLADRNVSPETCLAGTVLSPPKLSPTRRNYWHRETTGISYNGDDDDDAVQGYDGASNVESSIRDGKYATGYIRWIVVSSLLAMVVLLLLLLLLLDPRHTIAITRPSRQTYRRRIDSNRESETMAPNAIIKRKRYRKAFYSFSEACVNKN